MLYYSPEYEDYISRLPVAAHDFLEEKLDWDHDGVDKDLIKIAESMGADWEITFTSPLELTQGEIDDLKENNKNLILLRYYRISSIRCLKTAVEHPKARVQLVQTTLMLGGMTNVGHISRLHSSLFQ